MKSFHQVGASHPSGVCRFISRIASPEASVKGFNSSIDAFERPIRRKDLFPSPTLLDMKAEIQIMWVITQMLLNTNKLFKNLYQTVETFHY